jgi:hypothetical protein
MSGRSRRTPSLHAGLARINGLTVVMAVGASLWVRADFSANSLIERAPFCAALRHTYWTANTRSVDCGSRSSQQRFGLVHQRSEIL